tara:strand:+ start:2664 stop:3080 length:417 start_codon:yes stop_codon:yes gene_type:complete
MKKSELKNIIKECVKEVLFEEGVLSNLVAEVAFGITKAQGTLTEAKQPMQNPAVLQEAREQEQESRRKKLLETKRKMLDAMGNSKLANAFEGTKPLKEGGSPGKVSPQSPLAGRDPNDAGVDISGLFSVAGAKWNALK